jgi:hypothetical protein
VIETKSKGDPDPVKYCPLRLFNKSSAVSTKGLVHRYINRNRRKDGRRQTESGKKSSYLYIYFCFFPPPSGGQVQPKAFS